MPAYGCNAQEGLVGIPGFEDNGPTGPTGLSRRHTMFWLLLACSVSAPDSKATDVSVPLNEAMTACASHADPDRSGKCMVTALQTRSMLTSAECARVTGRWRGLCVIEAMEAVHGPLKRRYQDCAAMPGDARNCRFRLWQADVLALQPGHPDHALELEGMREVVKRHRLYIAEFHPGIDDEMWTRFWGAWWEQRGATDTTIRNPETCEAFPSPIDIRLCKKWAPAAYEWLDKRLPSAGTIRAPAGAPGGGESTPP